MRDAGGRRAETLILGDGDEFTLGKVRLLLILTDGRMAEEPDEEEAVFPDRGGDLFLEEMEE